MRRGVPPRLAGRTEPVSIEPWDPGGRSDDAFVLDAVRALARDAAASLPAPPAGATWMDRAAAQGVLHPLLVTARQAGHEVGVEMSGSTRDVALRSLAQRADTTLMLGAFAETGVASVIVKGPVLGELVYARPHIRASADVDVLIHPGDLRRAVDTLAGLGALRIGVDWRQRTWAQGCEIPITMPSGSTLDLHWDLLNRPRMRRAFSLPIAALLERRTTRSLAGGAVVPTLDDLDLVLHVLLHACMDGCDRLRAVLDVQQSVSWLSRRGVTPAELAARAAELGLVAPASLVLRMTAGVLQDGEVRGWAEALGAGTRWSRWVGRRAGRPGGGAAENPLTRRLTRYAAPSSAASARGLVGYGLDRATAVVVPDRPEPVRAPTNAPDPVFDDYVRRAGPARSDT